MVLTKSLHELLGMEAPDFSLPGTDDAVRSLTGYGSEKLLVIIFMCNHCPYVQAVLPRLNALSKEYAGQNVQFVGINSNDASQYPEDSFASMKLVDISFPYLFDENQEVAKSYGAVCTPDIFVFDENRVLMYHGRVDDNWQDAESVENEDLKEAIRILLAGGTVPAEQQIPSMGCNIKWKNEEMY